MGEYSEAFVAFDVSKMKHAVAIADGGRGGEVRFLGDISSSPTAVERLIRKLAGAIGRWRIGAGLPSKLSSMLPSRSSFRRPSTRSRMPLSVCAAWNSSWP